MDIKALRQEEADLLKEKNALTKEGREILAVDRDERDEERYAAVEERVDKINGTLAQVAEDKAKWERMKAAEIALPSTRVGSDQIDTPPPQVDNEPPKLFSSFGEQLQAIYRAGMNLGTDQRLLDLNAAAIGAGEAIGADGGFLVQTDFAAEIYRKMTFQSDVIGRVRKQAVSGNGLKLRTIKESSRANGSRWGGVTSDWLDEGTAPTAGQVEYGRLEWSLKKVAALSYATDELLEDAEALSGILTQAFSEELLFRVEDAIINGTGAGRPAGILGAAALVTVDKQGGQTAATIVSTNLSKMWARLHVRSRANAVWFINQELEPQLDELSIAIGTGGTDPRIVTYGPEGALRIKGKPIAAIEYCAALGTVGDIILADLDQYLLIDKNGIRQDSSMHVRFTTDEMAFRAIYRVDGQSLWESDLTPFKGTDTVSPFVALATRG